MPITPKIVKEMCRRLKEINPDGVLAYPYYNLEYQQKWQEENKEHLKGYLKSYRKRDYVKHASNERKYRRRSRIKMAGSHTLAEWNAVKANYNNRCAYCGIKPKELTKDHIRPLAKGGSNTIYNIIPACRLCNIKKYTHAVKPLLLPLWPALV